jgi:hypothetical protein
VSEQRISTANGRLQFNAPEAESLRFVGLSNGGGSGPGGMAFALRLQSGVAEVRENGAYKVETRFAAGDTFRITISSGTVTYARNGVVFYTSAATAGAGLVADLSFFDMNALLSNVSMSAQ